MSSSPRIQRCPRSTQRRIVSALVATALALAGVIAGGHSWHALASGLTCDFSADAHGDALGGANFIGSTNCTQSIPSIASHAWISDSNGNVVIDGDNAPCSNCSVNDSEGSCGGCMNYLQTYDLVYTSTIQAPSGFVWTVTQQGSFNCSGAGTPTLTCTATVSFVYPEPRQTQGILPTLSLSAAAV